MVYITRNTGLVVIFIIVLPHFFEGNNCTEHILSFVKTFGSTEIYKNFNELRLRYILVWRFVQNSSTFFLDMIHTGTPFALISLLDLISFEN
jgi:hypothetical protein